ncbi:MAG: hypothetical protein ACYC27_09825 [Armatimonadota bacterium]
MWKSTACALMLVILLTVSVHANIMGYTTEKFHFNKVTPSPRATWENRLTLTDSGIEYSSGGEGRADLWVQTDKFPVGMAWRPPKGASTTLTINGSVVTGLYRMNAFIRYSVDGEHWSTWYNLEQQKPISVDGPHIYKGRIQLPQIASERYDKLEQEWNKLNPQVSDNADTVARWIAKQYPSFFSQEMPFLGYAQIRLEFGASRVSIKDISVDMSWGTSGIMRVLPSSQDSHRIKWHFDGQPEP